MTAALSCGEFKTEEESMQLYTAGTGNGQRAAIAVNECGVTCSIHVLNLAQSDQKKPEYLKINPTGRIPTLIDYSDYREVSGVKMPFHWTVAWLDGQDTVQLTEVRPNLATPSPNSILPGQCNSARKWISIRTISHSSLFSAVG